MAVGKKANIAIIDLNEEYTITRDNIYSKAKNKAENVKEHVTEDVNHVAEKVAGKTATETK